MAIAFARARYLSRASGGSAARSPAYSAREHITAERTGEVSRFRHRDAPEHHAVLLPAGADLRFADSPVPGGCRRGVAKILRRLRSSRWSTGS